MCSREGGDMAVLTYRDALNAALREEMTRDDRVFLMGEEVAEYDGAYKVSRGLLKEFGPLRVVDTPIAELGFAGIGVGAAMVGLRPIIEFMTWNFALLAIDQVVNSAAKMRYMSGGQVGCPIVFRGPGGSALQLSSQHSQAFESWYAHIPGLKVVAPGTPADAKGLLKSAIRDDNPVIFLEDKMMYNQKGPLPEDDYTVPLGQARIYREGRHATIICTSSMLYPSLEAADRLAGDGIELTVIDPRTISPLDEAPLVEAAIRTGHVLVVDEAYQSFGVTAEIAARIQEKAFYYLDEPVRRLGAADVPVPFSPSLEDLTIPSTERIEALIREMLA